MISIKQNFESFHSNCLNTDENQSVKRFISLLIKGMEIYIEDKLYNDFGVLHIRTNGNLLLCKKKKNEPYRKVKFSNIECISTKDDELYVTLFDITTNDCFCKIKFTALKSANIFKIQYNELVSKYKDNVKITACKKNYFKLD